MWMAPDREASPYSHGGIDVGFGNRNFNLEGENMKSTLRMTLFMLACMLPAIAGAATFKTSDEAVALTDQAMKRMVAGDLRSGFELIKPYSVVPPAEIDATAGQALIQQPMLEARFGRSLGYELLRNDTVGDALVQLVYLHRFETHAMVWRFILYRGAEGWSVNSFKYVDDITAAF